MPNEFNTVHKIMMVVIERKLSSGKEVMTPYIHILLQSHYIKVNCTQRTHGQYRNNKRFNHSQRTL